MPSGIAGVVLVQTTCTCRHHRPTQIHHSDHKQYSLEPIRSISSHSNSICCQLHHLGHSTLI
uniref:Putative ovule protein n=1 Tax=Solanum chacoense TaxID=4108 RepID=A0A0V0H1C4_SOLCH